MRRVASVLGGLRARRSTGTAGIALAALGVVALAAGLIVGGGLPASSRGAGPAAKVSGAATVQRRDLIATDTESGTLTYASPQTVFNRLSGTITWLPSVGEVIKPGQTLYQVDGQPVVLFDGTTPAYRDLSSGVSNGPDVLELNRDLVNMGFDPDHEITVNDTWQTGTTDAVERWQGSLGQTETGTISLGQVVFLPGTQRVDSVDAVLGSTGGSSASGAAGAGSGASGSGGSSSAGGSSSGGSGASGQFDPSPEFVSLTVSQPAGAAAGSGTDTRARAASVSTAAVKAAWASACARHDLERLADLLRAHPALLASRQIAACARAAGHGNRPRAEPPQSADSGQRSGRRLADRAGNGTSAQSTSSATAPTSSQSTSEDATARFSAIVPAWDGSSAAVETRRGAGAGGRGSTTPNRSSSSGSGANNQILPALKALLRAEALLLQRTAASSARGTGGTSGSPPAGASGSRSGSASSGAARAGTASGSSAAAGGAGSAGGSAASGASGASGGSGAGSSGPAGNAQAILGTTSNQLDVVVNLDATKQSEAVVGEPVTVEMPDGSVVNGKITQVSPVAQSSSSASGAGGTSGASGAGGSGSSSSGSGGSSSGTPSATVPVTIALRGHIPASGLDQAAVSVNFEQQVERGVLSVPVTALLATAGGGYAVQEAAAPHRLIPVTPGLFAAGYVQVSSSQIYPGLQVTDSQG